jgi:Domain of unknown function (DUF3854)
MESSISSPQPQLNLTAQDRQMFARLGVDECWLVAACVFRVTDQEVRAYGFNLSRANGSTDTDLSGVLFPCVNPETGDRTTARLRRDRPDVIEGRQKNKYVSAWGDNRHLYFPHGSGQLLKDASVLVVFVESEKSAPALAGLARRRGLALLPIAIGGCFGWLGETGITENPTGERCETKGPLADLHLFRWKGRTATILFDANVSTNVQVRTARRKLAGVIAGLGARVLFADLPARQGVNGPDDLICVADE